jgi:hypothetical protein
MTQDKDEKDKTKQNRNTTQETNELKNTEVNHVAREG